MTHEIGALLSTLGHCRPYQQAKLVSMQGVKLTDSLFKIIHAITCFLRGQVYIWSHHINTYNIILSVGNNHCFLIKDEDVHIENWVFIRNEDALTKELSNSLL